MSSVRSRSGGTRMGNTFKRKEEVSAEGTLLNHLFKIMVRRGYSHDRFLAQAANPYTDRNTNEGCSDVAAGNGMVGPPSFWSKREPGGFAFGRHARR